jgi:hypothetical protein
MDGIVMTWDVKGGALTKKADFYDFAKSNLTQYPTGIVGIDRNDKGDTLVSTVGGEVFEIINGKASFLVRGHYAGELWGCATSNIYKS